MKQPDLQRAARVSGMRRDVLPSFEQVERRRFELWILSTLPRDVPPVLVGES
jgi:hypothetical protein